MYIYVYILYICTLLGGTDSSLKVSTFFSLQHKMIYRPIPLKAEVNCKEKWVLWTLINICKAIHPLLCVCNSLLLIPPALSPDKKYPAGLKMSWMEARAAKVCGKWSCCHLLAPLWYTWCWFHLLREKGEKKKAKTQREPLILSEWATLIVKDGDPNIWCPRLCL